MPPRTIAFASTRLRGVIKRTNRNIFLYILLFIVCYLAPLYLYYRCDVMDIFEDTNRPGEAYVSDESFFGCVAERLAHSEDDPERIPYFLMPVTMDYQDMKVLLCNITVPITYIMFINNGEFIPLRKLLDRLSHKLNHYVGKRLFIIHHPENIGYAAAVNQGLRHVLTYPIEKVPWLFISNADVRFGPGLLKDFIVKVKNETSNQAERIQRLEAEVVAESTTLKNVGNAKFAYRSDRYPVVTAPSLPYRIRAMNPENMSQEFSDTYGVFYTQYIPYMCAFALPRLTIATVGFFDENFYPAYGEDIDYGWRMEALGFKNYCSSKGRFIHYENGNLKAAALSKDHGIFKDTAYFNASVKFARMNNGIIRLQYRREKWFPDSRNPHSDVGRKPLPFRGNIPVDMWVLDEQRLQTIREIGESQRCRDKYKTYDPRILDFNVTALANSQGNRRRLPAVWTPTEAVGLPHHIRATDAIF